jgi:histidine ammonia-lyase
MMSNNRLNNLGRYSVGSSQKNAQIQAQQASARSIDQNPKQLAQPVQVMKEEIHDN